MVVAASPALPRPSAASRTDLWDTRAFLIRGDDRTQLRNRIAELVGSIDRNRTIAPGELASILARELVPGGARLGIVAESTTDLLAKLRRAAERLADPRCRQIRDAAGVYYFDQPLYESGTLALLFPGEGAQYANMLADLCPIFPEVEATFAWCDQLAKESGRASLRAVLHPGVGNQVAADEELRKLGPSIFGVLVADLAITRILNNLGVSVSAVAGHSAGELAALLAAGAMNSQAVLGPRLVEIMDMMQRLEDEAGGFDTALLAIGAGRAVVEEVTVATTDRSVVVAMDNCPHQCVAVGPTSQIETIAAALLGRGLVCERLPFRRPYHTPHFEPWMGPFRELFAGVPFTTPHTPVYCCSTGALFPRDPDAIRTLAVNHWVSPVEFARMIESMYRDGVRLFVEAGPRGNLSAFVEDILRGKSFAALPANVARRSGPTQVNHLVAQLAAHHVPLDLEHLFAADCQQKSAAVQDERDCGGFATGSVARRRSQPLQSSRIMTDYLGVMEQFLDVQRDVMGAFLAGRGMPAEAPLNISFSPDLHTIKHPHPAFALIERIERLEPGCSVVFRRTMDEQEDLFADDHTLGGRGVSRTDPRQNGLPVLPMTFSLEAMAEAAALLVPDKVVVAIRNVRLFRWLPFDPNPTTLEVRAVVTSVDPATGVVEVKADVRDLGNSFIADGANKIASEAILVLADRYPDAPRPYAFKLTDEVACKSTVEDLRRNMFHGPLFQMIRTLDRIGREGIEGTLEVQARTAWFRSNPNPTVVLDPVLIDAAMHILGAWHLEQPDWTGRILLPYEVQRIEFFGPTPSTGGHLIVRGHNEQESPRHFRHGLEVFGPDGRLWLRLTGAGYWRFYLPFGHVNFFGPKDEYFLSRNFPEAVPPRGETGAHRRCHLLEPPADLKQPVLRAAGARVTMTPRELAEFRAWNGTDHELNDWFFGRMLAKDAVRAVWADKHGEAMFPADIESERAGRGIVCTPRGDPKSEPLPPVRVAILHNVVVAFSAFADAVGIAMVPATKFAAEADARAAAARLAIADAFDIGSEGVDVAQTELDGLLLVRHDGAKFRVQTARHKDVIIATTLCEAEPS
jgi:malonyl CoA-acyl carrier protein transacylase